VHRNPLAGLAGSFPAQSSSLKATPFSGFQLLPFPLSAFSFELSAYYQPQPFNGL